MHLKVLNDSVNDSVCCDSNLDMSRRRFLVAASVLTAGLSTRPLLAAGQQANYSDAVKAHASLRGYWQFDGDLVDAMGKAPAKGQGSASFAEGVVDGKAICLMPEQSVAVQNTDHLRGRSATLELFFKLASPPQGVEDPVIIAQTAGQQARYIVGVKNDLSALIYQNVNGDVLTTINLPTDQPIEVGRWYHLGITSFDLDLRAYVDGYECSLVGGAFEFTRRGPAKSTMTFGSTTVNGWGSTDVCLDEVACYAEGLTLADFQNHLRAAGWEQRLKESGEIVARVEAERNARRARKTQAILSDPALTAPGKTRVYEGEHLDAINFTVGGIGAGGIQFNGKAEPAIWQIACNYSEERIADSFLAVRAQTAGGEPVIRALQTESVGPFAAMSSLKFEGEYPLAKYRFEEPALPLEVELEVFNPFIPMDLKNSAIPCAIYTATVTNPSPSAVKVDVLAAQKNALGYAEGNGGNFGKNQNRVKQEGDATLLHMTRSGIAGSDMVLMTRAVGASGCASWDSVEELHGAFDADGSCKGPATSEISAAGKTVNGALSVPLELAPGETKSVTFALTWYFEGGRHGEGKARRNLEGEGGSKGGKWNRAGQNYTNWWPNAIGLAEYLQENLAELIARTRLFHDTLYESTLPVWLLDRMSSQLAVLRSQTCWWAADGYFGAWEGCNPTKGCCAGNCTHVWHYAQAHARLLPELGRKMREQDYSMQLPSGLTPYRHTNQSSAADGHFGTILNTYREHLCATDESWLKSQWPKVKKAIDWGINHYNPKRDGFLQTVQHNTLDGDMTGCSSWIGSLYLSSLEAGARMADTMGEPDAAAEYRRIRESGKKLQNDRLWNGEYYIQEVGEKRIQDYLDGCHIDQILGEWWADQVGIDRNFPTDRSHQAMQALLKHNFFADFHGQSLKPRQYCEVDDGGMKMITWPNNPQPIPGMKYGDEVMTGFEYSAAVSLIQNGMLHEGLMLLKVISDRYNGRLRTEGVSDFANGAWGYSGNPYGDDECGKFYGRSLSVWSALIALQGFQYDGPAGIIGFRPRLNPEDHASFFTVAEGYGLYTQVQEANQLKATLDLREGQLRLSEVSMAATKSKLPQSVRVTSGGNSVTPRVEVNGSTLTLEFESAITLTAGQQLEIDVELA
ncbi:GH116 family glycosyl-hydrolase [Aporhodopirellula aestuarii]|uniref:GH116 family glycosyl-hydrolase n=1 Tax=Aporhodopirellula aestuarii TaxID=2950107 RepID=A0ABT0TZC3_9BACT|nr:GH116 family glycosyl-hydrolase [Aporhodopirellula aestuarii]MCM2369593.1 GH116 family glycosyl-hydrolase [Aporhodopirellula aestuarii]